MEVTKHDLCADSVRLDWDALEMTAKIAVRRCLDNIHDYYSDIQNILNHDTKDVRIYTSADYLLKEAKALQVASETLYTISKGRNRKEILAINKNVKKVDIE